MTNSSVQEDQSLTAANYWTFAWIANAAILQAMLDVIEAGDQLRRQIAALDGHINQLDGHINHLPLFQIAKVYDDVHVRLTTMGKL